MRKHQKGCTEKCRTKNIYLEKDLARNIALAEKLMHFNFCDVCAGHQDSSFSPPSGSQKGFPECKNGCGLRLRQSCLPLMEAYSAQQSRIDELKTRFEQLEEADINFEQFREQS